MTPMRHNPDVGIMGMRVKMISVTMEMLSLAAATEVTHGQIRPRRSKRSYPCGCYPRHACQLVSI